MIRVFLLLVLTDGAFCKQICSYQDVLNHLNLSLDNEVYRVTRPVLDHSRPTEVELDIVLYAILAVIEKTQTFIPFVWAMMKWNNELIRWDPAQFCGITHVTVPREMLWKPDILVYEMIEKDSSSLNPYILLFHNGTVVSEEDMKIVSTCKMDVHKFPFDTQQCNISVSSALHWVEELRLRASLDSSRVTEFSREIIKTQGEWEFLQLTVVNYNFSYGGRAWEQLVYTFSVKRRPLLHVMNFLVPILFFLVLDLASFFISDERGEKLSFKVTILLAISVLLLILNDILPSMSNRTPLIATYCIVIFALMLLSVLETIFVTYLMEKSLRNKSRVGEETLNMESTVDSSLSRGAFVCKEAEEEQHEVLPATEEVNSSLTSPESRVLLLILDELRRLQRSVSAHVSGDKGVHVWAKRINTTFFIFYLSSVAVFLPSIYREWNR